MDKKRTGERLKANDKRQKTENKSKEEEKEKQKKFSYQVLQQHLRWGSSSRKSHYTWLNKVNLLFVLLPCNNPFLLILFEEYTGFCSHDFI